MAASVVAGLAAGVLGALLLQLSQAAWRRHRQARYRARAAEVCRAPMDPRNNRRR